MGLYICIHKLISNVVSTNVCYSYIVKIWTTIGIILNHILAVPPREIMIMIMIMIEKVSVFGANTALVSNPDWEYTLGTMGRAGEGRLGNILL